ncbi:MAG: hypothetical protein WAU78_08920 [Roseiarcus sp.]
MGFKNLSVLPHITPSVTLDACSPCLAAKPVSAEVPKQALQRNHDGAVIVSSSKVRRLPQYARIAQEVDGDQ